MSLTDLFIGAANIFSPFQVRMEEEVELAVAARVHWAW
jgi:hypothetical protein